MRYHCEALDEGHPWRRIASFELQSDAGCSHSQRSSARFDHTSKRLRLSDGKDCRHVLGAKHEIWRLVMDSIRHGSVLMMESR